MRRELKTLGGIVLLAGCVERVVEREVPVRVASDSGTDAPDAMTGDESSAADATVDAGEADAAAPDAGDANDASLACPPTTPITSAEIDQMFGWKIGARRVGACTAAELAQFQSNVLSAPFTSYFALGAGLSATCQACVIAKDTDANWAPVVGRAADDGATGFLDFAGACFAHVESESCGRAQQRVWFCDDVACRDCTAKTKVSRSSCGSAARSGMCKGLVDEAILACPGFATSSKPCANLFEATKTLCGD